MKAIEIRNKYLNFFKKHGHAVIPSASLIPENDPSVLIERLDKERLKIIDEIKRLKKLKNKRI